MDITLTFDNGPTPGVTEHVLDTLARHDILSSFFVLGNKIVQPKLKALAKRAHSEGHWIANHTWTHKVPLGHMPDQDAAVAEITDTQCEMEDLAHPDRLFRPFGGGGNIDNRLLSPRTVETLKQGNHTIVLWNTIPRDWKEPDQWVDTALTQIEERDWSVIVIHDLPTGAMDHLDRFLTAAKDKGARFRQDYPKSVTPMVRGEAITDMAPIITV